jgi:hypothetical protein
MKYRTLLAAALLLAATVVASADTVTPYVVTIEQVGPNVVMTGSGEFDLTGLTSIAARVAPQAAINPSGSLVDFSWAPSVAEFIGPASGPSSFGSGGNTLANNTNGGPAVIFQAFGSSIHLFLAEPGGGQVTFLSD